MKKVKVIIHEWKCKEVEYICEVDDLIGDDGQEWDTFGIGYLDGSDLGTDAEGFNAVPISNKILDKEYDSKWDMVKWEIIKEINNG